MRIWVNLWLLGLVIGVWVVSTTLAPMVKWWDEGVPDDCFAGNIFDADPACGLMMSWYFAQMVTQV